MDFVGTKLVLPIMQGSSCDVNAHKETALLKEIIFAVSRQKKEKLKSEIFGLFALRSPLRL